MKTKQSQTDNTTLAEAFLTFGRQYNVAANILIDLDDSLDVPIYYLFSHSIELLFKAYLRCLGESIPMGKAGHDLPGFLNACKDCGLVVDLDLWNVVELLNSENSQMYGYRYPNSCSASRPALPFLQPVANQLLDRISAILKAKATPNLSDQAVAIKLIWGQPRKRTDLPATGQ